MNVLAKWLRDIPEQQPYNFIHLGWDMAAFGILYGANLLGALLGPRRADLMGLTIALFIAFLARLLGGICLLLRY